VGDVLGINTVLRRRQADAAVAAARRRHGALCAEMQEIGDGYTAYCQAVAALLETELDLPTLLEETAAEVRRIDALP
jgi:hypothetical protein